jgi:hypothetical protein
VYEAADLANGDGNGTIGVGTDWDADTGASWTDGTHETLKFFAHLRAAGLVPGGGKDSTRPANAYGGQIGIQDGALKISGHVTIFGSIEGPIAKIIEGRLDDGLPHSGRVQAEISKTAAGMDAGKTSSVLLYDDDKRYNMAFRL